MPESPEVQALVEVLDERMSGREIVSVHAVDPRIVKTRDRPLSTFAGVRVSGLARYGKYVGILGGERQLVLSFGRNGWIRWHQDGVAPEEDARIAVATLVFDDGASLQFVETGDFLAAAAWAVDRAEEVAGIAALGPDPIDPSFSVDDLDRALGARRKQIKALLQEQRSLAGIGNAYSDEILHRARLAPTTHAAALGDEERGRLYEATVGVMRGAVAARRGLPPEKLKAAKVAAMAVHGRGGEACPVCGDIIVDHVFAGASAQLCPTCQPG